jgi:hypothetical protein
MLSLLCEACFAEQDAVIVAEHRIDVNIRLQPKKVFEIDFAET